MQKNFYGSDLGKLQMHFHTSIRNVGLYLSVSLALLGASRYYRKGSERSRVKQLMFTLISLAFTTNAFLVSKYLLNDHMSILKNYSKEETKHVTKWTKSRRRITSPPCDLHSLHTASRECVWTSPLQKPHH